MKIEIKDKNGVLLKTSGTYCAENIEVVPVVEDITVTPSTEAQVETPSEGYCGIGQVNIGAVTADIDANIVPENIKEGVSILGVVGTLSGGSGETPSLYAPTIAISDTGVLTVTDTRNGDFADKYYLVIDDVQGAEIVNKTVDLTTVFADYAVGVYNVKVRVTSPNNELLAADSMALTYGVYSITYTFTHVTAPTAPAKILQGTQAEITLAADTDWFLPAEVSVANASIVEYDVTTGKLIIGKAIGEVTVTIEGTQDQPLVAKGKIITIESKQYRVIKVAGNVVEVVNNGLDYTKRHADKYRLNEIQRRQQRYQYHHKPLRQVRKYAEVVQHRFVQLSAFLLLACLRVNCLCFGGLDFGLAFGKHFLRLLVCQRLSDVFVLHRLGCCHCADDIFSLFLERFVFVQGDLNILRRDVGYGTRFVPHGRYCCFRAFFCFVVFVALFNLSGDFSYFVHFHVLLP